MNIQEERDGIEYVMIARGTEVLLEVGIENAVGFDVVARRLPSQLCHMALGTKKTYTHEGKCFHCMVVTPDNASLRVGNDTPVEIVVLAAPDFSAARVFGFIADVTRRFQEYDAPTAATTLRPDYSGFAFVVRERAHFYSTIKSIERVRAIRAEVDETRRLMLDNIDQAVSRGERLEDIESKSERLKSDSYSFHRPSVHTKRSFCARNCRLCGLKCAIITVFIVIVLAVAVFLFIKFFPWPRPHHHSGSEPFLSSSSSSLLHSSSSNWASSSTTPPPSSSASSI